MLRRAEITIAFATGHAYGLRQPMVGILIHVGDDTVSYRRRVLLSCPKATRSKLVMFWEHLTEIAAAGLDDTTMVIVTNTADYASVAPVAEERALAKATQLSVKA